MTFDRSIFFAGIRGSGKLFPTLSQVQVDRLDAYLVYGETISILPAHLAYILATVYHETGHEDEATGKFIRFLPVEETGKGKNKPYGKKVKYSGQAYTKPDRLYYGRGDVQLTWYENYEKAERLFKIIGLLANPDLALRSDIAIKIAVEGMLSGLFTGRRLSQYITDKKVNFKGARWIINKQDKADVIAGYAAIFLRYLVAA